MNDWTTDALDATIARLEPRVRGERWVGVAVCRRRDDDDARAPVLARPVLDQKALFGQPPDAASVVAALLELYAQNRGRFVGIYPVGAGFPGFHQMDQAGNDPGVFLNGLQ